VEMPQEIADIERYGWEGDDCTHLQSVKLGRGRKEGRRGCLFLC
jgi:hypothetical protein